MAGKTILTGVKPTGAPHLGNYVGAIRPAIQLVDGADKSFLFIADYHALNAVHDRKALAMDSYHVAATWLALGVNPDKTVFYRQSDIPEIFELTTALMAVTPKGLMDRSHAYKAAKDKNLADNRDEDADVNMGLYTYPILMAADILVMQAQLIPVGKDQVQHIEFARDIAGYFNNTFGNTLTLPEYQVEKAGAAIPGLDGRKMSKSYGNHIPVFMDSKQRQKMIMKIVTDSKLPEEPKEPDDNTVFQLYSHFAKDADVAAMRDAFIKGGMGYGDAKKLLAAAVEETLMEPSRLYAEYMSDLSKIDKILEEGAARARVVARKTVSDLRDKVGLKPLK
jgi:tryptophanyl-tRNA synthetase